LDQHAEDRLAAAKRRDGERHHHHAIADRRPRGPPVWRAHEGVNFGLRTTKSDQRNQISSPFPQCPSAASSCQALLSLLPVQLQIALNSWLWLPLSRMWMAQSPLS